MLSLKPVEGNPSLPLVFDGNPGILWIVAAALQSLPLPYTAFSLFVSLRSLQEHQSALLTLMLKGLKPHLTMKVGKEWLSWLDYICKNTLSESDHAQRYQGLALQQILLEATIQCNTGRISKVGLRSSQYSASHRKCQQLMDCYWWHRQVSRWPLLPSMLFHLIVCAAYWLLSHDLLWKQGSSL